jgi:hypothetical protein
MNNNAPAIYEWTKSPVPPNQWETLIRNKGMAFGVRASGEAYVDRLSGTDGYHWVEEQDTVQGKQYTVYYFWVKNKDSVAKESKAARIYSTAQLSKVVLNPSAAGFSWWAPISRHSIVIKGAEHLLNNSSTVVQIKKKLKGNEKHQQWLFVSENNKIQTIPEWMHVRFRDSLSAIVNYKRTDTETGYGDFYISKNVPDIDNLHPYAQAGNSVRPFVQSWFLEILEARRTLFKFINTQLINVDLVYGVPNWGERLNQTAYVWGDVTVDMTKIWEYADYYSADYDFTKSVTYLVDSRQQLQELNAQVGDYVRVLDQLLETDTIYEITALGGFKVVYRKNGTIQFLSDLWTKPSAGGWDIIPWDYKPWDYDLNAQVGIIIEALRNDVYIGEYHVFYGNMMCVMLRYTLSEQVNVDWIQKASTIEPLNLIGQTFTRPAEFERDNVSTLIGFYNTVKSYRDKIRDSNVNKEILESASIGIEDSYVTTVKMDYNRVSFGQATTEPDTTITGLNFVPTGWDSVLYDNGTSYPVVNSVLSEEAGWDAFDKQSEFDKYIQKIYQGIPASTLQKILSGTSTGRFYHTPHGEEAIDMRISDGLIIDTTMQEFGKTVRQHYYNNNVAAFILREDTILLNEVLASTTHIDLEDISKVPDASAENPGFVWIGNELVVYFVKTDTGITGLIRGAFNTQIGGVNTHTMGSAVNFMSAENILYDYTYIQNLRNNQFFNDADGVTIADSENPLAMRIKN